MIRLAIIVGALYGATGVGLGAYQAHGLQKALRTAQVPDEEIQRRLSNAQTAVQYQLVHALALVAVAGLALAGNRSRCLAATIGLMIIGTLLFSGGLAAHALTGRIGHPAIIPAGGGTLILAWLMLAGHACCCWSADCRASADA